jgi:glycosyltransferase involved in cell wall biosynthesis
MSTISPLVSVLLCAHNSRELVPIAIESYRHQTYPNLELVVVDDGDPIDFMVRGLPHLQYHYFPADNLAQKRNKGIREANGDIIVHFDSDDWSGPNRIIHQVSYLLEKNLEVVGYDRAFWFDTKTRKTAQACCGSWGASLCYRRDWALKHPLDETHTTCEDVSFLDTARAEDVLGELDGGDNFVALAHPGNERRPFGHPTWPFVHNRFLPEGFKKFIGVAE